MHMLHTRASSKQYQELMSLAKQGEGASYYSVSCFVIS